MKMSFFPGKLFLESKPEGGFELRFGEEVQTFRSEKAAVQAFKDIRTRLEKLGVYRASGHEHFNGSLVILAAISCVMLLAAVCMPAQVQKRALA